MLKPTFDRIIIRKIEEEKKTAGGIIIPDTATKERLSEGIVLEVGPGAKNDKGEYIPGDLKKGDRVFFSKWACTEISFGGEKLYVIKESEVVVKIA